MVKEINHDEEKKMFLDSLNTSFMSFFAVEGWEYIIDNLVHDHYAPEDFGEDEESTAWMYELALTEIEAQKALAEYFEQQMFLITGREWKMTDHGRPITIDEI